MPRRTVEYEHRTRPAAGVACNGIGCWPRSALRTGYEPRSAILNPEFVDHEDEADQRISVGFGGNILMRWVGRDVGQEGARKKGAELHRSANSLGCDAQQGPVQINTIEGLQGDEPTPARACPAAFDLDIGRDSE